MAVTVMKHIADENRVILCWEDVAEVCEAVITAMVNGLPEEAHTAEVCHHILHETEKMLDTRLIKLE